MATICYKEIPSFSLKELQETFLTPTEHLSLNLSKLGQQKKNTIIIGRLTDIQTRTNENVSIPPVMRLKLQEVLSIGNGLGFEAIIYGKNVKDLEDMLRSPEEDTPTWLSFSNVTITKYTGLLEPWSSFSLKVVDKNDNDDGTQKQEIRIFKQCKKPKKKEFQQRYAVLNDVKNKQRYTTFVVVKEVLKQTTILNNKNKHTLLCIVDPSCFDPLANRYEMLLHIFFNDSNDYLPGFIQHGDILRLREMVGDLYQKESKMFGKIFSSNAIVKFERREEDDEVTPITSNTNYIVTDQDKKMVKDLRQWWTKQCDCFDNECQSDNSIFNVKKLCQIKKPDTFTLNCLIKTVRVIERRRAVILRVTDGTDASMLTTTVNIDDATEEFSSQCEPLDNVIPETTNEIDVTIFNDMFEKAADIKEGDFIELVNLTCENLNEGLSEKMVLDFFMKENSCDINIIFPRSCKAKTIMNALDAARLKKIGSNVGELKSPSKSLSDEFTMRPQETDQRRFHQPQTPGNKDTAILNVSHSPVYPVLVEDTQLDLTLSQDCTVVEMSDSEPTTVIETRSMKRKNLLTSATTNENPSAHMHNGSSDCQRQKNRTNKRTIESSISTIGESKMAKYLWQPPQLNTVCNMHTKSTLTDFFTKSKAGDKCRVWALLKHMHIFSKQPCTDCQYVGCYHDWIWSLCTCCGEVLPSSDLRKRYPNEVLLSQSSLKCRPCSIQSAVREFSLQPFIKLELCLEDVTNDNTYSVALAGDYAESFFGVKPSFKWVIGSVSSIFHERTIIYKDQNRLRPFQFCLVNVTKPKDSTNVHICDTKLKF